MNMGQHRECTVFMNHSSVAFSCLSSETGTGESLLRVSSIQPPKDPMPELLQLAMSSSESRPWAVGNPRVLTVSGSVVMPWSWRTFLPEGKKSPERKLMARRLSSRVKGKTLGTPVLGTDHTVRSQRRPKKPMKSQVLRSSYQN